MRFAPSDEQQEFAASLADLLAASDLPAVVRAWAAGDDSPGRKLWTRLADLGILALTIPHEYGGFGATAVDLVLAFEQLGRFVVPGPLVESAAVLPTLLANTGASEQLTAIGAGTQLATLAFPPHVPYALDAAGCELTYLVEDGVLWTATARAPRTSVDAARRLSEVSACDRISVVDADGAFELGALATAAQLHGAGRALLDRAVEYAKQRRQFGVPIGSFQAVKHQLADVLVSLRLARPLLFAAALSRAPRDVSAAKIACSDAAYRAARVALQVHGAIGYTAEYDLSLELTKVRALVSAWGTQSFHRRRVWTAIT